MAGHSRPKDGVALLAYVPAIHVFGAKAWMPATSAGMTAEIDVSYVGNARVRPHNRHGDYLNLISMVSEVLQFVHSKVRRSWLGLSPGSIRASHNCCPHFSHGGRADEGA
jgi:hypothetical protein